MLPIRATPAGCRKRKDERADVTTDGQVSLSNGTLQRKRTLNRTPPYPGALCWCRRTALPAYPRDVKVCARPRPGTKIAVGRSANMERWVSASDAIIQRMSMDLTNVVVAIVGIAGTLGATVFTQYAASREKRLDAANQREVRAEDRWESVHAAKQAIYVDLNDAVRTYRIVGHDYLVDNIRGREQIDVERLDIERRRYRTIYSEAQMVLPDPALKAASEVNTCLGYSYRALHDIGTSPTPSIAAEDLHSWYDGALSDAVNLLRQVLREDLGVAERRTDIDSILQNLRKSRLNLWPD